MGYPGGKSGSGVYQTLINLMPRHEVYVEPFLGGGAVMRYKRPAELNIGIDLDEAVIESWSTAPRAAGAGSGGAISGGAPRSADAAISRGGRSSAGTSSVSRGSPNPPAADPDGETGGAGQRWNFLVADGIDFLRMNNRLLTSDTLVYCDPPYLHSTRICTRHYAHEMTDRQHLELLEVIRGLRCRVMISGYSSPMYAKALKGWNATAFQAATRGKPAAEWVWYNFDRPVELHDYRYLGTTRRERESIRRKQRRWVGRLKRMPILERQALLSAIAEAAITGDAAGSSPTART